MSKKTCWLIGLTMLVGACASDADFENSEQGSLAGRADDPSRPRPETAIFWGTRCVVQSADNFDITINSTRFDGLGEAVEVHSDCSQPTLEATWHENGVEQRVYLYFDRNETNWWVKGIRTYNGLTGDDADWIYYDATDNPGSCYNDGNEDHCFETPSCAVFAAEDVTLVGHNDDHTITGTLHFGRFWLEGYSDSLCDIDPAAK